MRKDASTNNQNKIYIEALCPMGHALSMIGNRWKPLILFKLIEKDLRFSELQKEIPIISERMLILSLRELEKDQLITRFEMNVFPKYVSYSLTAVARELSPILNGICEWGAVVQQSQLAELAV